MKTLIATIFFGFLGLSLSKADNNNIPSAPKENSNVETSRMDNQMMSLTVVNTEETYTYTKSENEEAEDDIYLRMDIDIMSTGIGSSKTYGVVGNYIKINGEYQSLIRLDNEKMSY